MGRGPNSEDVGGGDLVRGCLSLAARRGVRDADRWGHMGLFISVLVWWPGPGGFRPNPSCFVR